MGTRQPGQTNARGLQAREDQSADFNSWASTHLRSLAIMNAVPMLIVARNLGHSDTRMIESHYGHLAPSFVVDAIRAGAPTFGLTPSKVKALR